MKTIFIYSIPKEEQEEEAKGAEYKGEVESEDKGEQEELRMVFF